MKLSIKNFFSKFEQCDLVTFTEKFPNGKLHVLCSIYLYSVRMLSGKYTSGKNYLQPAMSVRQFQLDYIPDVSLEGF